MNLFLTSFRFQILLFSFLLITSCNGQKKTNLPKDSISQAKESDSTALDYDPYFTASQIITSPYGPASITRSILQDRKGNIWFATWEGIIRYDGNYFTNVTNGEGLRRFHVFSIMEDRNGNIWFGTIGAGVYRYDGKSFTNFTSEDGLASDGVACIHEDSSGNIWFGTGGGISVCDEKSLSKGEVRFRNFTIEDGLPDNNVQSIREDQTGKMWFGTKGAACSFDGKTFTKLVNNAGATFENVWSIIEDKKGNVWLGGNDGLWYYDGNSYNQLLTEFVGHIYEDKKGNIWISAGVGLQPETMTLYRYDVQSLSASIQSANKEAIIEVGGLLFGIYEDKDGGIWFGMLDGVCRYDASLNDASSKEKAFNYFKKPVAPQTVDLDPYQQQFNNLVSEWGLVNTEHKEFELLVLSENKDYLLRTKSGKESGKWDIVGVQHLSLGDVKYKFYFKGKNLVLINQKDQQYEFANLALGEPDAGVTQGIDGQLSAFIRRIFQDKNGNFWFGTNGDGVIRYDTSLPDGHEDALEYFSVNQGFGGVAVRGIVEDEAGNVWFGTSGGVTKYDGAAFTNFTERDGLINNDVWSIMIDSKGIIWIGTLGGVSRFDGKVFTEFDLPESEPDHTRGVTSARIVHCIMEDSHKKLWFATNGGAFIYDGKSLSNLSEKDGLCNNVLNSILEDQSGNIWFATHHNGVCRYDGKSFRHITTEDGVDGTEVWDLYEDRSGNIWFPVEHFGMYRYDGKTFTNFHKKEGLISGALQCTLEDTEGRHWFGGWMGLFRSDSQPLSAGEASIFSVTTKGPWH